MKQKHTIVPVMGDAVNKSKPTLQVNNQQLPAQPDAPLLNLILVAKIGIDTSCGGRGTCHLCRVVVEQGAEQLLPANAVEQKALGNVLLGEGYRLSCQIPAVPDLVVRVPKPMGRDELRARFKSKSDAK